MDPAAAPFMGVGTLAAILLVLRKRIRSVLVEGARGVLHPSLLKETQGGRDAVFLTLATAPTVWLGLSLKSLSSGVSTSLTLLGVCFLVSSLAIGSTYWAPKGQRQTPPHAGALLVGLASGLAVLPGMSRSGLTIATLLWTGVTEERAFELSLLVSLPALAGGELIQAWYAAHGAPGDVMLVYATVLAFVVGIGALTVLRAILVRRRVSLFAIYLFPLGLATLAWGYARP
jgi:undecaprenyl-diphosphatase